MLTPQDVTNREFDKAIFGGYDIAAVDTFLEQLCQDYSTLYRENAILKNKLKVLVDKVEEYRATEDAMRMALLSAKKTAKEITSEAEEQSAKLLAEAQARSQQLIAEATDMTEARRQELKKSLAEEEEALLNAKRATAAYMQTLKAALVDYTGSLSRIYDFVEPLPEAPAQEAVQAAPAASAAPAADKPGEEEAPLAPEPPQEEPAQDTDPISVNKVQELINRSFASADQAEAEAEEASSASDGAKVINIPDAGSKLPNIDYENLEFGKKYNPVRK